MRDSSENRKSSAAIRPSRASICRSARRSRIHCYRSALRTAEVCSVGVGSAGSGICDIAREFARRFENLARSLQSLHRGFDSRRRLSCSANRRTPITHGRASPDHCRATGALEADFIGVWLGRRRSPPAKGRGLRDRGLPCVTSELRGIREGHDRGRGPSRGGAERWAADSRSAVLGSDD